MPESPRAKQVPKVPGGQWLKGKGFSATCSSWSGASHDPGAWFLPSKLGAEHPRGSGASQI